MHKAFLNDKRTKRKPGLELYVYKRVFYPQPVETFVDKNCNTLQIMLFFFSALACW